MQIVLILLAVVALGLLIKWWYIGVPLLVVAGVVLGVRYYRDRQMLSSLSEVERTHVLAERKAARAARLEKWRADAEATKAAKERQKLEQGKAVKTPISQVGKVEGSVGLACPRCGGTQFKQRRSRGGRAGVAGATVATGGIGGLLAVGVTKQKQVQCVTCGARYQRG